MIGMQGDANVILKNTINVNQERRMIDYADASLHVGTFACMLMHVGCGEPCPNVQSQERRGAALWLFQRLFKIVML